MHDTIKYLNDAGITTVGAGDNEDDAHKAVSKDINGRNITVLNYMDSNNFAEYGYDVMPYANGSNPGYSAYDSEDAQKQIAEKLEISYIGYKFIETGKRKASFELLIKIYNFAR